MRSRPDCELGDPRDGELMFGTVWSSDPSSSMFASSANPKGDFPTTSKQHYELLDILLDIIL